MQLQFKIIIPLLDKDIKKEYLTPEAGLVGVYSTDINRPWQSRSIYLLYKDKPTKESKYREIHFIKKSDLWTAKVVSIKGEVYTLYTAYIEDNELYKFYESWGYLTFGQRAYLFLLWDDEEVTKFVERPWIIGTLNIFKDETLPEIDSDEKHRYGKHAGFRISKSGM